ncbi:hypothetical protein NX02_09340 [Sphingomonas sanxanigenens DSM 19645 = NX02]|uniref:FecR protein domain-containing protein n=2 Tax=Alphaproteobacteria TaxID=28211 RepID=W0A6M6_9SPHN|nr:hypothetical protein NX02_09340 [Sphingomonas sanxanigenens DSM 19645 = NX02]
MMSESAQALGPHFDPAPFEAPKAPVGSRVSRRQALAWGGGAVAVASMIAVGISVPAWGAITTGRGEIRLVPLEDGSTVLLNTETRIRVRYDNSERVVTLIEGEAYFAVTNDPKRPFRVDVGDRHLSTSRAAFRVRKLDNDPIDVLVDHGQVDMASPSQSLTSPLVLAANTRLILARPGSGGSTLPEHAQSVTSDFVSRELAWREGKIAFEGETLKEAANAFARYSDTRIMIRDPALAREPVTGLFAANDPAGFSRAIARVFDAQVRQSGDTIILTRSAAAP